MADVHRLEQIADAFARMAAAQGSFPTEFRRTRTGDNVRAWHVHPTGATQPEFGANLNDAAGAMGFTKRDAFISWVFERCQEFVEDTHAGMPVPTLGVAKHGDGSERPITRESKTIRNAPKACEHALRREIELIRRDNEVNTGANPPLTGPTTESPPMNDRPTSESSHPKWTDESLAEAWKRLPQNVRTLLTRMFSTSPEEDCRVLWYVERGDPWYGNMTDRCFLYVDLPDLGWTIDDAERAFALAHRIGLAMKFSVGSPTGNLWVGLTPEGVYMTRVGLRATGEIARVPFEANVECAKSCSAAADSAATNPVNDPAKPNNAAIVDEHWVPYDDDRIKGYMGGEPPAKYKGQLHKLAKRHPELRREATAEERQRLEKPSLQFVYNLRLVYDHTEGSANE